MTPLHFRDPGPAPLAWVAAGGAWCAQLVLPWTSSGTFSSSSLADGIRLIRNGTLSGIAPAWVAPVLLVLPAAGLTLVGLALVDGAVAVAARLLLALVGLALVVASVALLVSGEPSRLGPGGWTAVGGAGLAVAAVSLDLLGGRRARRPSRQPVRPTEETSR